MELLLPFNFTSLLILVSPFIFLAIKLLWRKTDSPKENKTLPPSPPKLPIIGHLHHLLGGLPHHVLARVSQKYGPVLYLQLGGVSGVLISSPEAAKEVLKDQDPACTDRPETLGFKIMCYDYSDFAFCPYNEFWKEMRKICILELLSARNVKSFESIRQDETLRLMRRVHSSCGEQINVTVNVFKFVSSILCRAAFGSVVRDAEVFIDVMRSALNMAGGFELADLFPSSKLLNALCWNKYKLLRMRRKLDAILAEIMDEHKLKHGGEFGGEDLVDALLRVKENGKFKFPITNVNIKGIIFDIFAGGTETSSGVLNWAMTELMRNPHVMAKAQAEIRKAFKGKMSMEECNNEGLKYIKLVIKETLRLHPPAALLPRACRDECMVNGYLVPRKSKVIVNVWSLGRDPKYWHKPEIFEPERFENSSIDFWGNDFEYIPFGTGKRMCPGLSFGLANVEVPLAQLLYHFDWKLPEGIRPSDIDMTEMGGLSSARKYDLLLVPTVYDALE